MASIKMAEQEAIGRKHEQIVRREFLDRPDLTSARAAGALLGDVARQVLAPKPWTPRRTRVSGTNLAWWSRMCSRGSHPKALPTNGRRPSAVRGPAASPGRDGSRASHSGHAAGDAEFFLAVLLVTLSHPSSRASLRGQGTT